jgi:hypothetical protein
LACFWSAEETRRAVEMGRMRVGKVSVATRRVVRASAEAGGRAPSLSLSRSQREMYL